MNKKFIFFFMAIITGVFISFLFFTGNTLINNVPPLPAAPYTNENRMSEQSLSAKTLIPSGIFWRTNRKSDIARYGGTWFILGGRGAHFSWCDIEKTPGNYNFSEIDDYIRQWKRFGKKSIIAISASSSAESKTCPLDDAHQNIHVVSPGWLFQPPYSVKFIDAPTKGSTQNDNTKDQGDVRDYWPAYWDPAFFDRFNKLYEALADHLKTSGFLDDVAWVEALHGRENSTSVTRDDLYQQYIDAFISDAKVRKDFNDDQKIDEKDFEMFWTDFLKQSIDHLTPPLRARGIRNMLVIVDFQTSSAKPSRYYEPFLTDVARYAMKQDMLFGAKALNVETKKMLRKPAIFIFPSSEFSLVPKALWNDVTSIPKDAPIENFSINYENALGGIREIPSTHINYTYIAPEELPRILAVWPNDCPELPQPSNSKNLCWPELEDAVQKLLPQLEAIKE